MDSSPNECVTAESKTVWYGERIESSGICFFKGQCITPALHIGKDWWRQLLINKRYDALCYILHECFVKCIPMLMAILRSHLCDQESRSFRYPFRPLLVLPCQPGNGVSFIGVDKSIVRTELRSGSVS